MNQLGFSTGCLHTSGIELEKRIKLYSQVGANAIELGFGRSHQLFFFNLSQKIIKQLDKYDFISIHASWLGGVNYTKDNDSESIIQKLEYLCQEIDVSGIVFHPDTIKNFHLLEKTNLPVLIENMDKRKSVGTHPKYFEKLKQEYGFRFVLDLQHVYEQDKSMALADDFVESMGERINHLHVSGTLNGSLHSPLYLAENKEKLKQALQNPKLSSVLKILEGEIKNPENLQREIDLLKELTSY